MMLNADQRRRAFRAALDLADYHSVEQWAHERGLDGNHVHLVVRGKRPSARLQVLLDAFSIETILNFADRLRADITADQRTANDAALALPERGRAA